MKKIWQWITNNSSALQGVAALLVILTALYAGFVLVSNFLKPDVLIQVDINESTVPEELLDWIHNAKIVLQANKDSLLNDELMSKLISVEMNKVFDSSTYDRLSSPWSSSMVEFGRLGITVLNQTEELISGVRLRVDGVRYFWDLAIQGTFLTEQEVTKFRENVEPLKDYHYLVLPQLPSLPAKSTLQIDIYGSVQFADLTATLPNKAVKVQQLTKVERSWLIDTYQHPYKLIGLFSLLPILALGLIYIWTKITKRIMHKSFPNALYDLACEKALEGNTEQAMLFLENAFKKGYSNRIHAMKDPDLILLHERADFKRLISDK